MYYLIRPFSTHICHMQNLKRSIDTNNSDRAKSDIHIFIWNHLHKIQFKTWIRQDSEIKGYPISAMRCTTCNYTLSLSITSDVEGIASRIIHSWYQTVFTGVFDNSLKKLRDVNEILFFYLPFSFLCTYSSSSSPPSLPTPIELSLDHEYELNQDDVCY